MRTIAWMLLLLLCSAALGCGEVSPSTATTAPPEHVVTFGQPDFRLDVGAFVVDKENQGVSLILKNPTNQELIVEKVDASCTCVGASVVPNCIPPGGQAQLLVKPSLAGNRSQRSSRITLLSPSHGSWEFILDGLFIVNSFWEPAQLVLPEIQAGTRQVASVSLFLRREGPAPSVPRALCDPASHLRVVQVHHVGAEAAGRTVIDRYELQVAVVAGQESDPSSGRLFLWPGSERPVLEYSVAWAVRPIIATLPTAVGFVGNRPQERVLFLKSGNRTPFRVLKVIPEKDWVTVVTEGQASSPDHRLRIKLHPERSAGQTESLKTSLLIETDHPKRERLEVPVTWLP